LHSARAFFLDRDGVINRSIIHDGKPFAPIYPSEFQIISGVEEALLKIRAYGYKSIIVTNQPDISNGKQSSESLAKIHENLLAKLPIDCIEVCTHIDSHRCHCRKPEPGMLLDAAQRLGVNLNESYMVGDRWRDVEAGQRAGCKEIFFIDYGYKDKQPQMPFTRVSSLLSAVNKVLK